MFKKIVLASAAAALLALSVPASPAFASKCSPEEIKEFDHKREDLFRYLEHAKKEHNNAAVKNIERDMDKLNKYVRQKCE